MWISPPPSTLLDIGCGDGAFIRVLAQRLPGVSVTGIDPVMHERVEQVGRIRFARASVEQLPFTPDTFDVCVASLSLHHWNDVVAGLSEAYRVLRPGGYLVIGDPLLKGWLSNRFLGWLAQKTDGGAFADPVELIAKLERAGFAEIRIDMVEKSMQSLFLVTARKQSPGQ